MNDFDIFQFDDLVEFARDIGAVPIKGKYDGEFTIEDIESHEPGEVFADFVAYIRDHGLNSFNYKFHVCRCTTINKFLEEGFYDKKYFKFFIKLIHIAKKRRGFDYFFPVRYNDVSRNGVEGMKVCKNCLWELNYKGYRNATEKKRDKIVEEFDLLDFYKEHGTLLPLNDGIPDYLFNEYSKNWTEISRRVREKANWKCENCGRNFKNDPKNLHVHHVNRMRSDNREENLAVLCKWCHTEVHKY